MSGAVSVARAVTITIPGTPAYALSPNSRSHWRVKHRESEAVRWATKAALGDIYRYFHTPVRIHWAIYLAKGGKQRDLDNLLPCTKPVLDQLVRAEVIPDDSPKWIPETPTIDQVPWSEHRGDPKIIVTIEEATQP